MKYKLINEDIKNKNLLDIVYENRNITKDMVEKLLGANSEDYRSPFEIFGIDKGIKQFKEEISKNNNILIIENASKLIYAVYFKINTDNEFGETSKTIYVNLDLIKGVKVKYGWGNKIILQ